MIKGAALTLATSVDTSSDLSTPLVPDTLDVSSLWSHGFPSADLVAAAAATLTPYGPRPVSYVRGDATRTVAEASRRWETREGPRARLVVGPGAVQIARTDPARAERASERARAAARTLATLGAADHLLEDRLADADDLVRAAGVVGDWPAAESAGLWADHLSARIRRRDAEPRKLEGSRSITAWSSKSRANMVRTLSQLDYAPLFASGRTPAMVTLTYPGQWQAVATSAEVCRDHVNALKRRYLRTYGTPLVAVWKREFQRRGAPHYHLHMTPPGPVKITAKRHPLHGQTVSFQQWLAYAWVDVVAHPDPLERAAMLRVHLGPRVVDFAEGMRARDPKRLAVYFSKHGAFSAKDYQNDAPPEWTGNVAPFADQGTVGRFWGVWGLEKAVSVVELSPLEATAAVRTLRRWQRANGFRVQRTVWRNRYNPATGEERRPRRRKTGVWVGARIRGGSAGFAVVNDGPAMVSTLSRYLDTVRTDAQDAEIASWLEDPARLREVDGYRPDPVSLERFRVLEVARGDCSSFVPLLPVMADRLAAWKRTAPTLL